MTSQQPAASSTQSQGSARTATNKPALQKLEDLCDTEISKGRDRMPKGFISRASSDYVERADKWLIPVK
jgi:hypothetical protein